MELYSKSQLNFALRRKARKAKSRKKETPELIKAAGELLAKREAGDYFATGPAEVIDEMWGIIRQQNLNRQPNDAELATIRDLKSEGWTVAAIACGLDLLPGVVAKSLGVILTTKLNLPAHDLR